MLARRTIFYGRSLTRSLYRKASIFSDQAQVDACASLGGDQEGQRLQLCSHGNRILTSTQYAEQYAQDVNQKVNRFELFPKVPPPDLDRVFLMYPNQLGMMGMRHFLRDTDALDLVPSAGCFDQYFPREIDTKGVGRDGTNGQTWRANLINNLVVHKYYNPRKEC
jgi:hypothetical protein